MSKETETANNAIIGVVGKRGDGMSASAAFRGAHITLDESHVSLLAKRITDLEKQVKLMESKVIMLQNKNGGK